VRFYLGRTNAERLYFIALAGMGMLTTVGVIVSMDTFGPISDNAQGIAEMSGEFEGRPAEILGGLDAVGNSTKAITKGMAIATAVLAATSLFGSFEVALRDAGFHFLGIRVDHPDVLVGLLIGGSVAFLFSSLAIRAVGRAASQVVVEVRNQFRRAPRHHGGHRTPRVRPRGGHLHQDLAARTDDAGPAGRAGPDHRRVRPEGRGVGGVPGGCDPHRAAPGCDAVELRRGVGQRQEAGGGRPVRRQGQRIPQGHRGR